MLQLHILRRIIKMSIYVQRGDQNLMVKTVTVLMPVYNSADFIEESLKSVFNQTYQNYKVLVVNDGSTDNTLEILKKYPVEIISYEKNRGISYALNLGIKNIQTDYFVRMDSDDIMHPKRLEIQVQFMEDNPDIFMMGTTCLHYDGENDWTPMYRRVMDQNELRFLYLFHPVILHPTVIVRTAPFKNKAYQYRSEMDGIEDFALFKQLVFNENIVNIDFPLMKIRKRENSASSIGKEKTLDLIAKVNYDFLVKNHFNAQFDKIRVLGKILYPIHYKTTVDEIELAKPLIKEMVYHFKIPVNVDKFIEQQKGVIGNEKSEKK